MVTARISIRNTNNIIIKSSNEREKNRQTLSLLTYFIENIPEYERDKYSKHCYPVATKHNNPLAFKRMCDRGLVPHNTWCLFNAVYSGNKMMTEFVLKQLDYVVPVRDYLPLAWAASIKRKINIHELLPWMDDHDIPVFNDRDKYDRKMMMHYIDIIVENADRMLWYGNDDMIYIGDKKIDLMMDRPKTCDCPNVTHMEHWDIISVLRNRVGDPLDCYSYSVSYDDAMANAVKYYGCVAWGVIEEGGHEDVDVLKGYL